MSKEYLTLTSNKQGTENEAIQELRKILPFSYDVKGKTCSEYKEEVIKGADNKYTAIARYMLKEIIPAPAKGTGSRMGGLETVMKNTRI